MVRKKCCLRLIFCLVCCLFFENTALGFGGGVATGVIQGKDPLQSGLAGGVGAGLSEMVAEKVLESHRDELNDIEKTQGKEVAQKRFNDIKKTAAKWGKIIAITTAFTGNLDPEVALQAANTSIDNNFFETMDYALFLNPKGAEIQKEVAEKMVETVKNMYEDRYSILLDMSPAGPYKNIQELITGQDLVTGKPVSRCVSGVSLGLAMAQPAVGFAKGALKAGTKELAIGMKAASTLTKEVAPALKTLEKQLAPTLENQLAPTLEKQLAPVLENQGLGLANSAMKTEVEVGKSLLKEEVGVAKSLTSNELKSVGEELKALETESKLAQTRPNKGPYKETGGHHVHAKKSFEGHVNYDPKEGFSMSREYMDSLNLDHNKITATQRKLFNELAQSGRPNTLKEHTRIAVESLVKNGVPKQQARDIVAESLRSLKGVGVREPVKIPWAKDY